MRFSGSLWPAENSKSTVRFSSKWFLFKCSSGWKFSSRTSQYSKNKFNREASQLVVFYSAGLVAKVLLVIAEINAKLHPASGRSGCLLKSS